MYDLKDLAPGAIVEVIDSDRQVSTWRVSELPETTLKTALPPSLWVTTGPPKLAMVTCGGPFDGATGHYLDNVIVWASAAGDVPHGPVPAGRRGPARNRALSINIPPYSPR